MIKFRVNGTPAPQGSKRHVGGGRMIEQSKAVGPWREAVRATATTEVCRMSQRDPNAFAVGEMYAPLSVTIVFVLARPKNHLATGRAARSAGSWPLIKPMAPKYPAKRPDVDKLARAVLDGLVMGGVMADDSQVCSLNVAKVYAANGEAPGAMIEVEAL